MVHTATIDTIAGNGSILCRGSSLFDTTGILDCHLVGIAATHVGCKNGDDSTLRGVGLFGGLQNDSVTTVGCRIQVIIIKQADGKTVKVIQ